jgi:outer membrane protein OmpA-like peptidoglycan-associated protein
MNLVKTIGRILPVALSLSVLVACGDKKSEKPAPVKQPEPVKVEAPAPEPEPAPFDFSKFAAVKGSSTEFLTSSSEVNAFLNNAFAKVEQGQATSIEFPGVSSLFELASADLSSEGRAVIAAFGSKLAQTNMEASVIVEGYTCDLGSVAYNDELSQRRAENAKAELSKYIPASKITAKWYGKRLYKKIKYSTREEHRRSNIRIQ